MNAAPDPISALTKRASEARCLLADFAHENAVLARYYAAKVRWLEDRRDQLMIARRRAGR